MRGYCPTLRSHSRHGSAGCQGSWTPSIPFLGLLRNARWGYRRAWCPFCEIEDNHRLAVLVVDGEDALRIEYCRCGGYLKTYNGEGSEDLLLADRTPLHLDALARDHGLKSYAGSLYRL